MADQAAINELIAEGYELLSTGVTSKACDRWLEAWEGLKLLMAERGAKVVWELNRQYEWSELPSNCVQELEQELNNAGLDDSAYFEKRISYCKELLRYVGDDKLMEGNTRRAIADSYFELGDSEECDRLYGQWLEEDPQWGWGYIGWSTCYEGNWHGRQNLKKASEIIERGLGVADVRDRLYVVDAALGLCKKGGVLADKLPALREERSKLEAASQPQSAGGRPGAAKAPGVGRNDPCPCGSGRKYKKCHGRG